MTLITNIDSVAKNDQLLVMASSAALRAAGVDMGLIDAVPCLPSSAGEVTDTGADVLPKMMIGRLKAAGESADDVRLQLLRLGQALKALGQMSQEEIAATVEQLQPTV